MEKVMKRGILTALLLGSGLAFADVNANDVLNNLHQANLAEIKMGQLAQTKGVSEDVKSYGKTLVSDHEASDKKVVDLSAKQGVTLKAEKAGFMERMNMRNLRSKTGAEFDKEFAKGMVDDHKKNIEDLQSAQKAALPQEVKELIGDTLPTLQKHLAMAQKIAVYSEVK